MPTKSGSWRLCLEAAVAGEVEAEVSKGEKDVPPVTGSSPATLGTSPTSTGVWHSDQVCVLVGSLGTHPLARFPPATSEPRRKLDHPPWRSGSKSTARPPHSGKSRFPACPIFSPKPSAVRGSPVTPWETMDGRTRAAGQGGAEGALAARSNRPWRLVSGDDV